MGNSLYVVAVVMVILWSIGVLAFNSAGSIHILLMVAIVAVLVRVIGGQKIWRAD